MQNQAVAADFPVYQLKQKPEQFRVIEDLGFTLTGTGEHLWLDVEKQNLTSDIARHIISKVFAVAQDQVSLAGKKDRHGITRQWFSVRLPGQAEAMVPQAQAKLNQYLKLMPLHEGEALGFIKAQAHNKKCQVGCHKGNFFEIEALFLGPDSDSDSATFRAFACSDFPERIQNMQNQGFPNFFGEQRFGVDNYQAALETKMLQIHKKTKPGRLKPKDAWACSQLRAYLFNAVLHKRLQEHWQMPQLGDRMNLTGSGSSFLVESFDTAAQHDLTQRIQSGDIAATGPLFGRPNPRVAPAGAIAELEFAIFARVSEPVQTKLCLYQEFARRPLWVRPHNFTVEQQNSKLKFSFWLPKGAYATECIKAFFQNTLEAQLL